MRWLGTLCLCLRVPCQCACADRTPVHTRRVMRVASAHAKCVAGILEATHHGYVVFSEEPQNSRPSGPREDARSVDTRKTR